MENSWLKDFYKAQLELQKYILNKDEITDNPVMMYNSATAAIVEIGEMLQTDTRWKANVTFSKKEPRCDKEQFKEELADVCIYLMNVIIFTGLSIEEVQDAINAKYNINVKRFGK